jgi:predicted esterase
MRPLLAPVAAALLAALLTLAVVPASAAPPDDAAATAHALFEGRITPAEAAQAWQRAKLEPEEAAELVRNLPLEPAPVTSHQAVIKDGFGRETDAEIVLPSDGPGPGGKYRVVVMLHGIGGDARQGLAMIPAFVPPHTIVVTTSAKPPHASENAEDLRMSRSVGMDITKRFPHWWSYRERAFPLAGLDYVVRRYPVDTDRIVLMGYSMGGFGTWNLGLRFHDRFCAMTPMAGGISREEFASTLLGRDQLTRLLLDNVAMIPLFFVHGDQDDVVPVGPERWTHEELTAKKLEHTYLEIAGGKHMLTSFLSPTGEEARRFKAWIEAQVRRASPRRVVHRAIGDYHPGAYWLRMDAMTGDGARVEAETQKNRVVVTTEGVSRLTLFVDPEIIDPRKNVSVIVDDKPAFQGKVRPSLQAVAESFARGRDPKLVYERMITVDVTPRPIEGAPAGGPADLLRGGGRR